MNILFVTWDGPQVDYLESLFLPIFVGLREHGVHFDVLQFRWGEAEGTRQARAACEAVGVGYRAVKVARGFGGAGALATALAGRWHVRKAVRHFGSDALMPRCLMPAIAVLAAGGDRLKPIIFDADGLAADERADFAGDSRLSLTYRLLRWAEVRLIRASTAILVRTPAAADILQPRAGIAADRFRVVINGRDQDLFQPYDADIRRAVRAELGIAVDAPLLVYAGSIGPQYRFDLIRAFVHALAGRRPDARLLMLTGSPGLAEVALGPNPALGPLILRVSPCSVAKYLAAADLGLAFRAEGFSSQAVAPLKVAEYLMCGVPVLGTAAVGRSKAAAEAEVFLDEGVGVAEAVKWLTETVLPNRDRFRSRARAVGVANYSLSESIGNYRDAIELLRSPSQRTARLNMEAAAVAE